MPSSFVCREDVGGEHQSNLRHSLSSGHPFTLAPIHRTEQAPLPRRHPNPPSSPGHPQLFLSGPDGLFWFCQKINKKIQVVNSLKIQIVPTYPIHKDGTETGKPEEGGDERHTARSASAQLGSPLRRPVDCPP